MSWNYRVIKHETLTEDFYGIHEVYYEEPSKTHEEETKRRFNKMAQGKLPREIGLSWTKEPVGPGGDTQRELLDSLRLYLSAFSKPILVVRDGKVVAEEEWS